MVSKAQRALSVKVKKKSLVRYQNSYISRSLARSFALTISVAFSLPSVVVVVVFVVLRVAAVAVLSSSSSVQASKEETKQGKGLGFHCLAFPFNRSSSASVATANLLLGFWRCPRKGKELVAPAAKIWPGCLSWPQASLRNCLLKTLVVATYMAENENLPPKVIKELAREIKSLDETPPDGIRVVVNEDTFSTIFADIEGPAGTPYEGGVFRMKLVLTSEFPNSAPKGYFLTKIFHPNVSTSGEICVNTLKKDWRPNLGLRHIFLVVRCLLIEPFPESALNEQAGKLLMEDYEEYSRHARLYTSLHAMKSKLKNKVNIPENAALAEGPKNAVVAPLAPCLTNKDNTCQGQSTTVASAEALGVDISTVQKKKDVGSTKVQVDKKKLDARKKSLKRL